MSYDGEAYEDEKEVKELKGKFLSYQQREGARTPDLLELRVDGETEAKLISVFDDFDDDKGECKKRIRKTLNNVQVGQELSVLVFESGQYLNLARHKTPIKVGVLDKTLFREETKAKSKTGKLGRGLTLAEQVKNSESYWRTKFVYELQEKDPVIIRECALKAAAKIVAHQGERFWEATRDSCATLTTNFRVSKAGDATLLLADAFVAWLNQEVKTK